jgi:hypothetical protein
VSKFTETQLIDGLESLIVKGLLQFDGDGLAIRGTPPSIAELIALSPAEKWVLTRVMRKLQEVKASLN